MKRSSFLAAALLGLGLSVALAVFTAVFASLLPLGLVLRATIAGVALVYLLVTLKRSEIRVGRTVVLAAWLVLAVALWWLDAPLGVYVAAHALGIWLVRSLYSYQSLISAGIDLSLSMAAMASAAWAFERSGNLFLACWCFFLVQALHVVVPPCGPGDAPPRKPAEDDFGKAHRSAEAALRRLAANS